MLNLWIHFHESIPMSHLSSLHFAMAGDCILSVGTAVCVFRCVPSACTNFCVKDGHWHFVIIQSCLSQNYLKQWKTDNKSTWVERFCKLWYFPGMEYFEGIQKKWCLWRVLIAWKKNSSNKNYMYGKIPRMKRKQGP